MKKIILSTYLLAACLLHSGNLFAQTSASLPEAPLPTVPGPVLRPQNAGSSTMQNVNFMGATNSLYIHSWDVFSMSNFHGIAWRRTSSTGATLDQGYLTIKYANDIDIALYADGGAYFALAAYYYDDGTIRGHYYDIYKFTATGLMPSSLMNLLTATPSFGRINVDANTPYGLAITWSYPGTGIFVKAANLPGAAFGPNVLLTGSAGYKDPDVCILRYTGNLTLQLAELSNASNQVREQRLNFATAVGGSSAGLVTEYAMSTSTAFGSPRIDGPDAFNVQKWGMVFAEYSYAGGTANERIYAAVLNTTWSATPTTVLVNGASYATSYFQLNNPVVAYNANANQITVGWITRNNTAVITGTTDNKYVAQYINDPGTSAPASVAASYMMVSNNPGGPAPVLAFSGQNTMSNFNGIHTAYSQYNTFFANDYSMVYKDKSFSSSTFRLAEEMATGTVPTVSPNPFVNTLSLVLPLKGHYEISITSIDGRHVYVQDGDFEDMQQAVINTASFSPGMYIINVHATDNSINFTKQILK